MKYVSDNDVAFVVYKKSSGAITKQCVYPGIMMEHIELGEGEDIHVVSRKRRGLSDIFFKIDAKYYIHAEDGITRLRRRGDYELDAIPIPCVVTIEGVDYLCNEQPTFEFNSPGNYIIEVDAGPKYLRKEFPLDYQP